MVFTQASSTFAIDKAQALKQLEVLGTAERFDFDSTSIPPHLIDAEEDILNCILLNPEAIEQAKHLPPLAFTQMQNRRIFLAAVALHEKGLSTDLMAVTDHLYKQGILAEAGGQYHLAELAGRLSWMGALDVRVQLLLEKHLERELAKVRVTPENVSSVIEQLEAYRSVTGDSHCIGDSCNQGISSISATVTTVTQILQAGFQSYEERQKLDDLQQKSGMSKGAFWDLVTTVRSQFDEVQPSDEIRLNKLIDWSNESLDFEKALPTMATDILHDAKVLNIDPIGIWQYLFPMVLSLAGKKVSLDVESHRIPAIAWTAVVAESGAGKTRAEKLVTGHLKKLQALERQRFEAEYAEYVEAEKKKSSEKKKGGNAEGDQHVEKPMAERMYLFEVATIQAVLRRLNEQGLNGSLWARDELAGLFKSFGQFSAGKDQEGLECLLKLWDGDATQVNRVKQEDSFFTPESRLSVAGGIQPGAFRQAFRDKSDSQGLQARFLFAVAKVLAPKRVKGYCHLSESLPKLYNWLDTLPDTTIRLSRSADALYDRLYEEIGNQAIQTSMPAIRAWMHKLPTQLLRIAMALHLIECYHGKARIEELSCETLKRAVLFAQYYRASFQVLQEKVADSDEISSILLKIWDAAVTRHPDGISTRDAYREIKAIQYRAKDCGQSVGAYTENLFAKLEQMGKGRLEKQGRSIRFVANLTPDQVTPVVDIKETVTVVTAAETQTKQALEVSLPDEVSPVTLEKDTNLNTCDGGIASPPAIQQGEAIAPIPVPNPSSGNGGAPVLEGAIAIITEGEGQGKVARIGKTYPESKYAPLRIMLHLLNSPAGETLNKQPHQFRLETKEEKIQREVREQVK